MWVCKSYIKNMQNLGTGHLLPAGGGGGGYIQGSRKFFWWCTGGIENKMTYGQGGSCISSGIGGVRCVPLVFLFIKSHSFWVGERGGSVVECRTPEREVRGSRPTAAVLCPWARHFTPRKYWLITQEAMAPSRYDWKIVDWDVKPQHNQKNSFWGAQPPRPPYIPAL